MDSWVEIVIRQLILYSLPTLVSLTLIAAVEANAFKKPLPHPFYASSCWTTWLPLLTAIAFHRGMIVTLPRTMTTGVPAALLRLGMHLLVGAVGVLLYAWSLKHQSSVGLPPLHQWWAKVLMFFNLSMAGLHLLPLPGFVVGEIVCLRFPVIGRLMPKHVSLLLAAVAATPLLDKLLGGLVVFPAYAWLSDLAA